MIVLFREMKGTNDTNILHHDIDVISEGTNET